MCLCRPRRGAAIASDETSGEPWVGASDGSYITSGFIHRAE